ncbi:baseplate or tail tube [Photobacterium aphoticum]|uniref:Baseplate or tail tube n=1 Tax=Photobacterium aphoticum TaxID=754436 RepID=A0A090R1F5_9GAMM|nr:baseplate or tail tube [Photobacterium aphoticum]
MIAEFGVRETLMNEAIKKVVRDGKVVTINTNKRKRKMTAAQKAALKKARLKAHSSSAKAARKKAMKTRHSRGM